MPRGRKQCKDCAEFVGARASACDCGYVFPKPKPKKKAKPFFKERRDFVKRMLNGGKQENIQLDMMTVTKIFELFNNDTEFLSSVPPPFQLKGSIKYFLTKDGREYLKKKKLEYDYRPPERRKIKEYKNKVGEDILIQKKKTLTKFLNDE
jgi:hypothetical protein